MKQYSWDGLDAVNKTIGNITQAATQKYRQQDTQQPAGAQPISASDLYGYLGPSGQQPAQAQTIGALNAQPVAAQPVAQPQTIANLVPLFLRGYR